MPLNSRRLFVVSAIPSLAVYSLHHVCIWNRLVVY
ncbi:hypothetical protein D915_011014, partial [Fasciola hepatica]